MLRSREQRWSAGRPLGARPRSRRSRGRRSTLLETRKASIVTFPFHFDSNGEWLHYQIDVCVLKRGTCAHHYYSCRAPTSPGSSGGALAERRSRAPPGGDIGGKRARLWMWAPAPGHKDAATDNLSSASDARCRALRLTTSRAVPVGGVQKSETYSSPKAPRSPRDAEGTTPRRTQRAADGGRRRGRKEGGPAGASSHASAEGTRWGRGRTVPTAELSLEIAWSEKSVDCWYSRKGRIAAARKGDCPRRYGFDDHVRCEPLAVRGGLTAVGHDGREIDEDEGR